MEIKKFRFNLWERFKRKKTSKEFKIEAFKLLTEQGFSYTAAAESLGISTNILR